VEDGNGVVVGEVVVPYRSAVHAVEVGGLRDARGDVGDDGGEAEREEGDPFGEGDLGGLWGERIEWGGGPVHFEWIFFPLFFAALEVAELWKRNEARCEVEMWSGTKRFGF
jgi:hypothetical protein